MHPLYWVCFSIYSHWQSESYHKASQLVLYAWNSGLSLKHFLQILRCPVRPCCSTLVFKHSILFSNSPWCFIQQPRSRWKSPSLCSAHCNTSNNRLRCIGLFPCVQINNVIMPTSCFLKDCYKNVSWHLKVWPCRMLEVKQEDEEIDYGLWRKTWHRIIKICRNVQRLGLDDTAEKLITI